jgi:hypothetical protein
VRNETFSLPQVVILLAGIVALGQLPSYLYETKSCNAGILAQLCLRVHIFSPRRFELFSHPHLPHQDRLPHVVLGVFNHFFV